VIKGTGTGVEWSDVIVWEIEADKGSGAQKREFGKIFISFSRGFAAGIIAVMDAPAPASPPPQ
jgi:hypothetical protein